MLSLQSTESLCAMNRKDSDTGLGKNNWVNHSKSIPAALQLQCHVSIDRQANTDSPLYETELTWHVRGPAAVTRLAGCTFSEVSCNRQWHTHTQTTEGLSRRDEQEGLRHDLINRVTPLPVLRDLHRPSVKLQLLQGWAKPAMCSLSKALRGQYPGYVQKR